MADRDLELRVWDAAESAVGRVNALLRDVIAVESGPPGRRAFGTARWVLKHGWSWLPVYLKNHTEQRRLARGKQRA